MESSNNSSLIEDLEQSLLEVMAKHLINDLNQYNEPIESEVRKQRKLLLNILLENNHDLEMN